MNKPDTLYPKRAAPRGILHERVEPDAIGYARYWPPEDLAPFIEHFWTVRWSLATPEIREVLPHPSVHLVLEAGNSRISGVPRGRFTRTLEGTGRVLGTKFRPGGFRPFLRGSVSSLTGRMWSPGLLLGESARDLEGLALAESSDRGAFEIISEFWRRCAPSPDPNVDLAAGIADRAAADRSITRVEQLAAGSGLGARTLQRLFSEYVGVSPKWVLGRYRLHEASERIASATEGGWVDLALDLGYADQAHFIRDFRRLVGFTPAAYAKSVRDRLTMRATL